jgi:hypothetical protein
MFKMWMESFPQEAVGASFLPVSSLALVGMVWRPVALGPGQSILDLTPEQLVERAVDWEATARHSAVIDNIGKEKG